MAHDDWVKLQSLIPLALVIPVSSNEVAVFQVDISPLQSQDFSNSEAGHVRGGKDRLPPCRRWDEQRSSTWQLCQCAGLRVDNAEMLRGNELRNFLWFAD